MGWEIIQGDWVEVLRTMPDESVNCVVTSPPYWGLRDYGVPPAVWGGEPGCSHEWVNHRYYTEQTAAKCSADAFSKPGEANATRLKEGRWRDNCWCVKCGAWRGCLGLEPTPEMFVEHIVLGFREIRRVLKKDGSLWLNMGDCYHQGPKGNSGAIRPGDKQGTNAGSLATRRGDTLGPSRTTRHPFIKPKDLVGGPWMTAFGLRMDGWYLRQAMPWIKRNPMPESVEDRPATQCEFIFLLTKQPRYFYNSNAVKMPASGTAHARGNGVNPKAKMPGPNSRIYQDRDPHHPSARKPRQNESFSAAVKSLVTERQRRSYDWFIDSWEGLLTTDEGDPLAFVVNTEAYPEAHFATFPPKLVEPCILAGCPQDGTVLDPFNGAGTTGLVATRLGRNYIGIELNPDYIAMAKRRIEEDAPLFNIQRTEEVDARAE